MWKRNTDIEEGSYWWLRVSFKWRLLEGQSSRHWGSGRRALCDGVRQARHDPSTLLSLITFPRNVGIRAEKVKRRNHKLGLSLLQNLWYGRCFSQNIVNGLPWFYTARIRMTCKWIDRSVAVQAVLLYSARSLQWFKGQTSFGSRIDRKLARLKIWHYEPEPLSMFSKYLFYRLMFVRTLSSHNSHWKWTKAACHLPITRDDNTIPPLYCRECLHISQ